MKSDEEKLKELFEMKEKTSFDKTIHKAKVFSIIKTSIISIIVLFIVTITFFILNATLLNEKSHKEERYLENYYNITMPNGYMSPTENDDRLMVGELSYVRYRFLGDRVVTDGEYKKVFTYMPLINCKYGDISGTLFYNTYDSEEELDNAFEDKYNKAGRSLMKFYHPSVDYKSYDNDIEKLKEIDDNKVAEMSLSFDKEYTMDEVEKMLPKDVKLNWFWVNTLNNDELTGSKRPFYEDSVYGIKNIDKQGEKIYSPENYFIDSLEYFKEDNLEGGLFDKLKNKETNSISRSDLKIIGVVVSGQVSELKILENQSYIRASKLGAVADRY